MLNQVICVGRITKDIEIIENDNKKQYIVTLAIPRSYKNADGIYETDFISCILWENVGEQIITYLKKGDLVGIKGRLQTEDNKIIAVAEKVTFLSSKKED